MNDATRRRVCRGFGPYTARFVSDEDSYPAQMDGEEVYVLEVPLKESTYTALRDVAVLQRTDVPAAADNAIMLSKMILQAVESLRGTSRVRQIRVEVNGAYEAGLLIYRWAPWWVRLWFKLAGRTTPDSP